MSGQATAWVFKNSPTNGRDRLVLLALAYFAGVKPTDDGTGSHWDSWPSLDKLIAAAGAGSRRTVQRCLDALVENGHLGVVRNGAPKPYHTNLYKIMVNAGVTNGALECPLGVTNSADGVPNIAVDVPTVSPYMGSLEMFTSYGAEDASAPLPSPRQQASFSVDQSRDRANLILDAFCKGANRYPITQPERARFLAGAQRLEKVPGLTPHGVLRAAQRLRKARSFDGAVTPIKLYESLSSFHKPKDEEYRNHNGGWEPYMESARTTFPMPPGQEDWAAKQQAAYEKAQSDGTSYIETSRRMFEASLGRNKASA